MLNLILQSTPLLNRYPNFNDPKNKNLESALEMALKEAVDDETFRKIKRMSYSNNAAEEVRDMNRFSSLFLFSFFF